LSGNRQRRWIHLAACALVLLFIAQVVHNIRHESLTWDEGDHIFAGYESWKTGDFGLNPEHPPLVKLVATLPLLHLPLVVPPLQNRFFKTEAYMDGRELLFRNGPANGGRYTAEDLTLRVRLFAMVFAVAAAVVLYLAASELFGPITGLVALAIFCFAPTAIAHSALVTTDMAASVTIFATVYLFLRWVQRPTLWRLLAVGGAAGLALAAKHSTVLLAPMLVLLALGEWIAHRVALHRAGGAAAEAEAEAVRSTRSGLQLLGALAAITVVGVVVLWSFYGFRYAARPAGVVLAPTLRQYVGPLAGVEASGILLVAKLRLLPESWLYGLADVRAMANGMPSFFFGHVYLHGVWYYFPVLFVIKSTLGLLAMLALTAFAAARGWLRLAWLERGRTGFFLTAPPAVYLYVAMRSHLNIGARHILPVWIFCYVIAAAGIVAVAERGRAWAYVAAVLVLLHVAGSVRAMPNYMAYANEAWGGPSQTYRYLSDSNTDWAQQLLATRDYLAAHQVHDCWIAYFAAPFLLPEDYGIPCHRLPVYDSFYSNDSVTVPPEIDGPVLISAGDLNGFEFGSSLLNPYESFRSLKPVTSIQDGILVFDGHFRVLTAAALADAQHAKNLAQLHRYNDALAEALLATRLAPGAVLPQMELGAVYMARGEKQQALAAYAAARPQIEQMDSDARAEWEQKLNTALAAAR
jgi:hypothetical protein